HSPRPRLRQPRGGRRHPAQLDAGVRGRAARGEEVGKGEARSAHRGAMRMRRLSVVSLSLFALSAPAAAQDIALRGFGVHAGAGAPPGQFVAGFQLTLGELVPRLRFQPDVEVGVGGGQTEVDATIPVYYRIPIDARSTFYAGGGVTLGS